MKDLLLQPQDIEGLVPPSVSTTFAGLRIHGLSTGVLKVKKSHMNPSLGPPVIMLDPTWTDWLPVWVWVIEHPEGLLVVDTGETPAVLTDDHWQKSGMMGTINRQIIRFGIGPTLGLGNQLKALGLQPGNVRWVVQTHLHIDHTDGLRDVPHAEVLVSRDEWQNPYGAVRSTWPQGFQPHLVDYAAWPQAEALGPLGVCAPLTQDGRLWMVPTPGHTPGHQSLLLKGGAAPDGTPWPDLLFAGDLAFTQGQILAGQIPGITADKTSAQQSVQRIRQYAAKHPTVLLTCHDPQNPHRLLHAETLPNA